MFRPVQKLKKYKNTKKCIERQEAAVRSWMPPAAAGKAIDILAAQYGVRRENGATDNRLRKQVTKRIIEGAIQE